MCESDRGEWGKPCPDCGKRLPARQKPLTSWHAQRAVKSEKLSELARAALTDGSSLSIRPENRKPRAA
jgi:ribosomal protein S26